MSVHGAKSADSPRFDDEAKQYDAILVMSFGGPEGPDDVMPFLENVTKGRGVPRERLEEVSHHYLEFGGKSPINDQNLALIEALKAELKANGPDLPIYFGNRNWHPMIEDTMQQMKDDGVKRAVTFFTSGFSCYSGCRQYREDIIRAQEAVGEGAPEFDKLRVFYNHPKFLEPVADNIRTALEAWPEAERKDVQLVFTAHSIPMGMAKNSQYELQLKESCRIIAEDMFEMNSYELVYQSRSGPPHVPWLEPDILDYMTECNEKGKKDMVIIPIGFVSDHMEVLFDLDTEAEELAEELGMKMQRAGTVGVASSFVSMIRDLIMERMTENPERPALGARGANHDVCPVGCCLPGSRPNSAKPSRPASAQAAGD